MSYLYYRSLLYTYLLEKTRFYLEAHAKREILPAVTPFQQELNRFVQLLHKMNIRPIFVLHAYRQPPDAALPTLQVENRQALRTFILQKVGSERNVSFEQFSLVRLLQAQVFGEIVRRKAEASGIPFIDPRPAFAQYKGKEKIFCDTVHLTDEGNRMLADLIAESPATTPPGQD